MNIKNYSKELVLLFSAMLMMGLSSCNIKSDAVPFPQGKTEFLPPSSESLRFSEPQKIEWLVNDSTTFKLPIPKKVDLAAVPSKPFYPDGFIPIDQPMIETGLTMKPDKLINFKELPSKSINFKTSILETPKRVKARLPKLNKSASLGIFEFGEDQGMPSYLVTAMMEDSNGMMWIATDKGICRFDGEYIDIFDIIDSIFTGAQANVRSMLEDDNGRIWVYTAQMGFYVIDLQTGIVRNASQFGLLRGSSMIMDSRGMIWLGTINEGVFIIDPNDFSYKHVAQLKPDDSDNALLLAEDGFDKIWIGSDSNLSVIDYIEGTIKTVEDQNEISFDSINALFSDSENRIWVSTAEKGVSIIDPNQNKIQILGHEQGIIGNINHFTEGNNGNIWMSSNSEGVYIFDPAKQTLKHLNEDKGLNDDLSITSFLDSQGQIWMATNKGLNLIDTYGLMPNFLTEADGLSWPNVWSFMEDKHGDLWLGSWERMDLYDSKNNTIKRIDLALQLNKTANIGYDILPMPSGDYLIRVAPFGVAIFSPEQETITLITQENGMTSRVPSALYADHSGKIWLGTFRNGNVEVFDPKTNISKRITNKQGLIGNIVWSISEDALGQIWIGTDLGINIINEKENTISYLLEDGKINERNSGSFLIDDNGRIWVGTRTGILVVDQKNNLLTSILSENGLISEVVYTIYADNGMLYVGTENGLTAFTIPSNFGTNTKVLDVKSFGKEQGLIFNDYNAGAAIAYDNKLWWGIETEVLTVTEIPKKDTIPSTTYISGIAISDQTRSFYDTSAIFEKYPKLDTLYTSQKDTFYTSGKLPKETGWLKENNITWDGLDGYFNLPVNLSIPFEQNYVSFQFTGTELANRNKTRYSYYLEGFDSEWSEISDNPFSENYRNLPAGDYTFKVRSRTFDGIWSEPAEFSFTILPHWTNTWWAWMSYIITFMFVVGSIVQYRSRALQRENVILDEKVKHRTAQLNKSVEELKLSQAQLVQSEKMASLGELTAGIAHEIQNPLNFVNNFAEVSNELIDEMNEEIDKGDLEEAKAIAKDIKQNLEKINHHGKRADSIVKGMLQHSRSSNGKKEPTNINALADEYLRLAYHGLRAKDKSFNATMVTDFDDTIGTIDIVPQDIGRVILNLITNAFYVVDEKKKSGIENYEPTVRLSTKKLDKTIEIRVADNGNGIPESIINKIFEPFFTTKPTGKGTGLGLSMSYEIVTKSHAGDLKVETEQGIGTTFIITLPN